MLLRRAQRTAVDLDAVARGIDPRGQRVDRLAVDGHGALDDQRLALAPRGDAGVGEDLLQALAALLLAVLRQRGVNVLT